MCPPEARRLLIAATRDGVPTEAPPDVAVMPAYEWMLAPSAS